MSTIYSGIPDNAGVSNFTERQITDATNASPVEITTNGDHGYQTGDYVFVLGVLGNLAANSPGNYPWRITRTASDRFTLDGSTGSGAYTIFSGMCWDASALPALTIPSDGDTFDAAAWNVAIETLADRQEMIAKLIRPSADAFLRNPTGVGLFRDDATFVGSTSSGVLIGRYQTDLSDDTWATADLGGGPMTGAAANGSWTTIAGGDPFGAAGLNVIGLTVTPGIRCNAGDCLEVFLSCGELVIGVAPIAVSVSTVFTQAPSAVPNAGAASRFPNGYDGPVTARGYSVCQGFGRTASVSAFGAGVSTIIGLTGMGPNVVGMELVMSGASTPGNNGRFRVVAFNNAASVDVANPSGVAPDANNTHLRWHLDDQKFAAVISSYGIGGASTYDFRGHAQLVVNHYRNPSLLIP
jgi:hypothetical protein